MSKDKSEHLFNLIKTLSKGEKRFFKIYSTRLNSKESKKFIVLFDAIEKQKQYDEAKILAKYKLLNPQQLPNLKVHLYFQLLKCLKLCNSSSQDELKIVELIDYSRVLYNKCLYKECIKMIDKAKTRAIDYDYSILLLEILELEKLVLPKTIESGNEKRVEKLIVNTNQVAAAIKNINVFSNLSLKLKAHYTQIGSVRNKNDMKLVTEFFKKNLPVYKESGLTFQEKLYLYSSYVGYYLFIQDFKKGYSYAIKWLDLFEKQPEMINRKLEYYIRALNSLLSLQNKLYKYKDFLLTQKKLVSIKRNKKLKLTENINLNLFKVIYIHEINRHFMLGEFKSGTRIVSALENELNKFIPKLDKHSLILFYYKIACLYIGSGNYKVALTWLNKIYNEQDGLREDINSFVRILLLVCNYELGNDDILEYHIRSTYRYLIKIKSLGMYQKYILTFLKHLFQNPNGKNLKKQFVLLKSQMLLLQKNKYEKRAFIYFDIISWLESKIENRTVQEIIKEKAQLKINLLP